MLSKKLFSKATVNLVVRVAVIVFLLAFGQFIQQESVVTAQVITLQADLSVTTSDDIDPVTERDPLTYTIVVTNNGPDAAENVTLSETLPAGAVFNFATINQGSCGIAYPLITCQLGTITIDAGYSVTMIIRVTPGSPGVITNTVSVASDTDDPDTSNNSDSEDTTVNALQADLSVTTSDDVDPVIEGDPLTYTIVVTNNGPDAAENVTLSETLPAGAAFNFATINQGSCGIAYPLITCQLGTITIDAGYSVTMIIRVTPGSPGVITNTVSVASDTDDPDTSNNSDSEETTIVVPDSTPPETILDGKPASPTNSASATFIFHGVDDTTPGDSLTYECSLDGGSFSACVSPSTIHGFADGSHTIAVRAIDGAGNQDTTPATSIWVVDTTPPTLNPVVTPNPVGLYGFASVTSGAADALSGLASENCDDLDTSSVGDKSVTCHAMDLAGNTNSASVGYRVVYSFTGFFSPVDNMPTLNLASAGRAIPVKFSLGGDLGLNVFAVDYPRSEQIVCNSIAPVDGIETTLAAGSSSLSYDPVSGQYNFVWKTERSWAGTCRQLVVKFADGTVHWANFKFK